MTWINEKEAAAMINRKPRTLRKMVKAGVWPVAHSAINGRRFLYSEADIKKLIINYSTIIKN